MSEAFKEKGGKTERGKEACPCHLKKCGKRRKEIKGSERFVRNRKSFGGAGGESGGIVLR